MRIVSLLPSATEICYFLGLTNQLVGISHDCDWPEEIRSRPVLSSTTIDPDQTTSKEIDDAVRAEAHKGNSIYHVDADRMRELDPDLILTQELCEVCAPSFDEVQNASRVLNGETKVVSLEPSSLSDILDTISLVGTLTGTEQKANSLISELTDRMEFIKSGPSPSPSPRILCLEWLDPPYLAGHWVPEMVELAGGTPMNEPGVHSRQAEWEALDVFQPNLVVFMPCGFQPERTEEELRKLDDDHPLFYLDPVREGRIVNVNGSYYFNRPGPRVFTGLEILARVINPSSFENVSIPDDAMQELSLSG